MQETERRREREVTKATTMRQSDSRERVRLIKQLDESKLDGQQLRLQVESLQKETDRLVRSHIVVSDSTLCYIHSTITLILPYTSIDSTCSSRAGCGSRVASAFRSTCVARAHCG